MTELSDGRRMTRLDATAPALVRSVALGTGSDGRLLLASAGGDGTVRLWEVARGLPLGDPLIGHTGPVWSVAFGNDPTAGCCWPPRAPIG
jgi:WD40 repeat protein